MLVNCPECGKQISDKAKACPHCGYPMEEKQEPWLIPYDPETMTGKTPADDRSIETAQELYGDLLVTKDGRVWNEGGQVVAEMKYK